MTHLRPSARREADSEMPSAMGWYTGRLGGWPVGVRVPHRSLPALVSWQIIYAGWATSGPSARSRLAPGPSTPPAPRSIMARRVGRLHGAHGQGGAHEAEDAVGAQQAAGRGVGVGPPGGRAGRAAGLGAREDDRAGDAAGGDARHGPAERARGQRPALQPLRPGRGDQQRAEAALPAALGDGHDEGGAVPRGRGGAAQGAERRTSRASRSRSGRASTGATASSSPSRTSPSRSACW